jgi:hypothetical protein
MPDNNNRNTVCGRNTSYFALDEEEAASLETGFP